MRFKKITTELNLKLSKVDRTSNIPSSCDDEDSLSGQETEILSNLEVF